ncbi:hypothetical protein WJX73_002625 [Symbiochloris irregularis]|uniref:Uncharacterized protein n=1 Tax=Symbiochloris irregularis TaxID=706552 RepID=A0AAW1PSJ5_9CHLO
MLKQKTNEAVEILRSIWFHRRQQLQNGKVDEVMAGVYYRPEQRLVLWAGGLRPSDVVCCTRIGLAAAGLQVSDDAVKAMDLLQQACLEHQRTISEGLEDAVQHLARLKAVSRYVVSQGPSEHPRQTLQPQVRA